MKPEFIENRIVKVNCEDSSFLYFTLESNEGLCFYSTIEKNLDYCTLSLSYHQSLKNEVQNVLNHFSKNHFLEYIS